MAKIVELLFGPHCPHGDIDTQTGSTKRVT